MSDENLGVGKRTIKRTERVEDFDNEMAASKARREQHARSKRVAAQEAELLASEQPSEDDDGEDDYQDDIPDEDASDYDGDDGDDMTGSPQPKAKPRPKAKGQTSQIDDEDPERARLLDLISILMKTPREQLTLFETSALQALWDQKVGHNSANPTIRSKAAAKPKAKSQSLATPKARRLKATVPMKSQITMIGSPLVALKQGEQETARILDSPLVERRKRDAPIDQVGPGPKRIHLDAQVPSSQPTLHAKGTGQPARQSKTVGTANRAGPAAPSAALVARPSGPVNMSRASSRAPSGPPSRAGSAAPTASRAGSAAPTASSAGSAAPTASRASSAAPTASRAGSVALAASRTTSQATPISRAPVPTTAVQPAAPVSQDVESSDIEVPGLGDGTSDEYRDEDILDDDDEDEQVPAAASGVSGGNHAGARDKANGKPQGGQKKKKERPTTAKFEGVEREIVNRAVECTLAIKSQEGFFPDASEGTLMIRRGWEMAVHDCGEEIWNWEINQDHITVIRARVGSFRSRGRSRINDAFRGPYKLNITEQNSIEQVKKRAKDLYPVEFHRNPAVASKRAGHYRHPFLAEAVYLVFFTGDKPLATRFPDELSTPTIPMIAIACTMVEDLLIRYGRDGCYIKETKGQNNNRSVPKDLQVICARHEKNLVTFQNAVPAIFTGWIQKFAEQVRACGGKKPLSERRQSHAEPGVLDISAFADEGNYQDDTPEPMPKHPKPAPPVPRPRPRPVGQASNGSPVVDIPTSQSSPSQPAKPLSLDEQTYSDEEMADVESPPPAIKEGRQYEPLDDDVNWGDGDEEMADRGPIDAPQSEGQGSSGNTQRDVVPPKAPAPSTDEDDDPLTDLDDPKLVPPARVESAALVPDVGTTTNRPESPVGATERGIDQLKAKQSPPAQHQEEKQAKQGGRGRRPKDAGAVTATKGRRKAAAKNTDVDTEPRVIMDAPKMATRAASKLSKAGRG